MSFSVNSYCVWLFGSSLLLDEAVLLLLSNKIENDWVLLKQKKKKLLAGGRVCLPYIPSYLFAVPSQSFPYLAEKLKMFFTLDAVLIQVCKTCTRKRKSGHSGVILDGALSLGGGGS